MSLELDHVFVAASFEAPEMEAIRDAGFVEGPTHDHPGQGTASRGIFFENAYLELIWLTDPKVASGPLIARTRLAQRADPSSEALPYGFGLRSTQDPVPRPPFDSWSYAPPYLPEGASFAMATNSELLDEPLLFVLPWSRPPTWDVPGHPCGARRLTGVSFAPPVSNRSAALSAFLAMGLVRLLDGSEPLLRIQLDHARQGRECDLRPRLPLSIQW